MKISMQAMTFAGYLRNVIVQLESGADPVLVVTDLMAFCGKLLRMIRIGEPG